MYNKKENVETKNQDYSKNWEMCHTFVSKHTIRAVRVALMSLGMTFSFTPEVQITKNYRKNTIHWGYIGKYNIVLTRAY